MASMLFKYRERADGLVSVQVFSGVTKARRGSCGNLTMHPKEWKVLRSVLQSCPQVDIEVLTAEQVRLKRIHRADGYA